MRFLRLSTKSGLAVADYFEMDNEAQENGSDTDLGSGGTLLLNQTDSDGEKSGNSLSVQARTRIYMWSTGRTWESSVRPAIIFIRSWPEHYRVEFGRCRRHSTEIFIYGPVGSPLLRIPVQECETANCGGGEEHELVRVSGNDAEHFCECREERDCVGGREYKSSGAARV